MNINHGLFDDLVYSLTGKPISPFVDPVSNLSCTGTIDVFKHWGQQAEDLRAPNHVRYFLHESAHHGSFMGPVGAAISTIAASTLSFPNAVKDGQDNINLVTRDMIVYQFVWGFFKPLLEGLALFQEHDSVPGKSAVASNGILWLTRILIGVDVEKIQSLLIVTDSQNAQMFDYVKMWLVGHRLLSNECAEAKKQLLESPAKQPPYYLIGYLAVKAFYKRLAIRSKLLAGDPDFLITFMNDYWFQDHKLAAMILGNTISSENLANDAQVDAGIILNYLYDKWESLLVRTDEYAAECELFLSKKTDREPSYRNKNELPDRFIDPVRLERRPLFGQLMKFRNDFRYSLEVVKVKSDGITSEVTAFSAFGIKKIPTITILKKGVYEGSIEGVLSFEGYRPIAVLAIGASSVAMFDPIKDEWNAADLIDRYHDYPSHLEILNIKQQIRDQKNIDEHTILAEILRYGEEQMEGIIASLYGQLAFQTDSCGAQEIMEKLNVSGFSEVFGAHFSKSIRYSLFSSTAVCDLEIYCRESGEDLSEIILFIKKVNEKCEASIGWKPFDVLGNQYLVSRI